MLRISFSSKENLGFDHTIERLPTLDREGGPQFEIRVGKTWYRTQRLISNIGAEAIRGRGTRVWEVRKLDRKNGTEVGPLLVLKDSWVDADRDREATILREIRKSATDETDRMAFDIGLLHVENSSDIRAYNSSADNTRTTILRETLPEMKHAMDVKKYPKKDNTIRTEHPPHGGATNVPSDKPGTRKFTAKVHHRIVFKEVGKTIMEAEHLGHAFRAIEDIVTGMWLFLSHFRGHSSPVFTIPQCYNPCISVDGSTATSALVMC